MTRKQTVIVKLKRSSAGKPWGIRIAGGADLGTPIVVTRSENEALQRGDVIKKIDDYDARDVRQRQPKVPSGLPKSPLPPPLLDDYSRPTTPQEGFNLPHEHLDEIREEKAYLSQPHYTNNIL